MTAALIISGILNFFFLAALVFLVLAHQSDMEHMHSKSWKALLDMADQIKRPDAQFIEAIRAQAAPLTPGKDPVTELDEEWLAGDESETWMGDDLSPVFDPEEVA